MFRVRFFSFSVVCWFGRCSVWRVLAGVASVAPFLFRCCSGGWLPVVVAGGVVCSRSVWLRCSSLPFRCVFCFRAGCVPSCWWWCSLPFFGGGPCLSRSAFPVRGLCRRRLLLLWRLSSLVCRPLPCLLVVPLARMRSAVPLALPRGFGCFPWLLAAGVAVGVLLLAAPLPLSLLWPRRRLPFWLSLCLGLALPRWSRRPVPLAVSRGRGRGRGLRLLSPLALVFPSLCSGVRPAPRPFRLRGGRGRLLLLVRWLVGFACLRRPLLLRSFPCFSLVGPWSVPRGLPSRRLCRGQLRWPPTPEATRNDTKKSLRVFALSCTLWYNVHRLS